jgi:hypothetical protein
MIDAYLDGLLFCKDICRRSAYLNACDISIDSGITIIFWLGNNIRSRTEKKK